MAKYIITTSATKNTYIKDVRTETKLPFPTVTISGDMDNVAYHINKMLTSILTLYVINGKGGYSFPRTSYSYKSNLNDICSFGFGMVRITNFYSADIVADLSYKLTAERI